jgi:hypothetical protein
MPGAAPFSGFSTWDSPVLTDDPKVPHSSNRCPWNDVLETFWFLKSDSDNWFCLCYLILIWFLIVFGSGSLIRITGSVSAIWFWVPKFSVCFDLDIWRWFWYPGRRCYIAGSVSAMWYLIRHLEPPPSPVSLTSSARATAHNSSMWTYFYFLFLCHMSTSGFEVICKVTSYPKGHLLVILS